MDNLFVVKKRTDEKQERVTEEWNFDKIVSACQKSAQHIDKPLKK